MAAKSPIVEDLIVLTVTKVLAHTVLAVLMVMRIKGVTKGQKRREGVADPRS